MQHQNTVRSPSSSESEASGSSVAHNVASREEMELVIDFDNVEDILDFSVGPYSETANAKKQSYKLHKKMVTTEPVKLLEVKSKIDNFVNNDGKIYECHEVGNKAEPTSSRRFQCNYCGSKFLRSAHLYRHIRIHTGDKPYVCDICRKRFSRSDYKAAHLLHHQRALVHYCCVCGKAYDDLTKFAEHCRSHADSEYMRIAMGKEKEILIVEDPILVATFKQELEEISCMPIEIVDNSTTEECIACVENPLYSLHRPIMLFTVNVH